MISKSRGRISIFGEHSDWLIEYKGIGSSIPDEIIGLSSSIDLGMEYEIESLDTPKFIFIETFNGENIEIDMDYNCAYDLNFTSEERLIFWAVKMVTDYILAFKEYDSYQYITGCQVKVKDCSLPVNKGLASSTSLISTVIESILKVNNIELFPLSELVYYAESEATPSIGKLDMIVTESPGIRVVRYNSMDKTVKYENDILGSGNFFMKNRLAIIDIGKKSTSTDNILKALQSPFEHQFGYIMKKTISNLFGETTTNFSKLGMRAIRENDIEFLGILMWEFQKMYDHELRSLRPYISKYVLDPVANKFLKIGLMDGAIYGGKCMGSHGDTAILVAIKDFEKLEWFVKTSGYKLYLL